MSTIFINEIIIKDRRREDFGDVEGLAESIRRFGLFHPPVIDDQLNLIAGERRIRACTLLGWTEIPVRLYKDLTDQERAEMELDENRCRKDLTPFEKSKQTLRNAEVAAKVISSTVEEIKPQNAGRKSSFEVSKQEIAKSLGIGVGTLVRSEQHVEAVEKYPELASIPTQKDALTIAKNLDLLPEDERESAREKLINHDPQTIAILTEKNSDNGFKTRAEIEKEARKPTVLSVWVDSLYKTEKEFNKLRKLGGIRTIAVKWDTEKKNYFKEQCLNFANTVTQIAKEIEETL